MRVLGISVPILTRDMDAAVARYTALTGDGVKEQFELPERGVRIALLAGLTVIEGSDKALGVLRDLRVTFTVDSLADYETHLRSTGATILQGPSATPAGTNMIVRDVEGVLIEFVEAHHEEPSPKL